MVCYVDVVYVIGWCGFDLFFYVCCICICCIDVGFYFFLYVFVYCFVSGVFIGFVLVFLVFVYFLIIIVMMLFVVVCLCVCVLCVNGVFGMDIVDWNGVVVVLLMCLLGFFVSCEIFFIVLDCGFVVMRVFVDC